MFKEVARIKSVNHKRIDTFQSMRLTFRSVDLCKADVQAQQGSKVIGASIIHVAGKGLTHRQLCSSSQASKGHTPTKDVSLIHSKADQLPQGYKLVD